MLLFREPQEVLMLSCNPQTNMPVLQNIWLQHGAPCHPIGLESQPLFHMTRIDILADDIISKSPKRAASCMAAKLTNTPTVSRKVSRKAGLTHLAVDRQLVQHAAGGGKNRKHALLAEQQNQSICCECILDAIRPSQQTACSHPSNCEAALVL